MRVEVETTFWAKIYMSGSIAVAEQVCRESCYHEGLCVTVEPTKFIYTGGEETGFVVGLINYPRFPQDANTIMGRARQLALLLLDRMYQHSALIMTPETTEWYTKREDK